ncbi:manganese-dependent inorganic pyrophosphatase [Lentilactobacillus laojiaonis]|uniref:manganese-dependent inorganic pyrophosphatase n=1 Tax=Lentilactobacillus laojiaonis TaxID=2883998 RepID=UPI001D0BA1DF|nr:manganese-dependent inorganic pyrophosphatase [Lentilactobacillus laojiaonis]UDM32680.1 manganese-dependent inorganic pyrophosphatase [Lentilactobacillus laojiaonis]
MKQYVFGHQNPDTDAIVAAIAFSYLQNQRGYDTQAVSLGEAGPETVFALNYFHTDAPKVITNAKPDVDSVMLVDHNEFQQSVADIEELEITHVVDHHRIANFNTNSPLYYMAKPVGCTSTILTQMFIREEVKIPKEIAGLMMSAIISDTLLLKSPTTTEEDKLALKALAEIAGVNYEEYGIEMLKAGTNVDSKSDKELIDADAKSFDLNGNNVRIDQINVVDFNDVTKRKDDLMAEMQKEAQSENYDLFVVMVTDVLNSNSKMIVYGDKANEAAAAFNANLDNDMVDLPGIVSRKKQVVPALTDALK